MSLSAAVVRIRTALARGEYLIAYDEAASALSVYPDDEQLRYYAVLTLARAGASDGAAQELRSWAAAAGEVRGESPRLAEDIAALEARLAKDRATAASPPQRRELARTAAEVYESIWRRFERPYTCINAATMWLLADEKARARMLAREAFRLVEEDRPGEEDTDDAYWAAATKAEASLVLGAASEAVRWLRVAAQLSPNDIAARATTRTQLALICRHEGADPTILEALPVPGVLHYCGHRASRFPPADVSRVAGEVRALLEERAVGMVYGSLASGADLIVAGAALDRGAELHAFLPFQPQDFVATSVADAGEVWVQRFERCIDAATTVTCLDDGPFSGNDALFTYCAQVAMGHALIRAAYLTASVAQLAIWDGRPVDSAVGTSADVRVWKARGGDTHVIRTRGGTAVRSQPKQGGRVIRAMLFADFGDFSKLEEALMVRFVDIALQPIAAALRGYDDGIITRRTWGDGLHVTFRDTQAAAHCALDIQGAVSSIDWNAAGFPSPLGLRIGAHAGPVSPVRDPVRDELDFTGVHVVRTARIEPRTPVGEVYVTDPFAALVTLCGDRELSCQYVGRVPTAKGHGTFPMYVLRRKPASSLL